MVEPTRLIGDVVLGPGAEPIPGGAIDVDATGRIVAVGPEADLGPPPPTVWRGGGLLMPGLVNAHAHGPMVLLRSAGDGLPLMPWLTDAVWPREGRMTPDDARVGMTLASVEMLMAGVTTSVEMYLFEDAVAEAIETTGGRAQIMAGVISAIAPDDAAFAARLDAITAVRRARHDPEGRLTVGFGPHSVYDLGPERLALVAEAARDAGATIHVHLEETRGERDQVLDQYGLSATQLLDQAGALEQHVVAAHGVWLDADDMALLGAADAAVVHCPSSNLKLGSGVAAIRDLLDAGVQVAIGSDGAASNDSLELWHDVRLAGLLARGRAHDPTVIGAAELFCLATEAGAAAIGLADVGALRPGAWADVIRLDLDHPALAPGLESDLIATVVWAAGSRAVSDVWVAGRRVVADGEITTVDRLAVQAQARQIAARLAA